MMTQSTSLCTAKNLYYLVMTAHGQRNDSFFDITMGSYNGAEISELVELYLLHEVNKNIKNQHLGLYRDNGLAITSKSRPIIERIKNILKIL